MNKEEFIRTIYNKNYVDKIVKKFKLLGYDNKINPYSVMIMRLVTSIIVFCVSLYVFKYGYIVAPLVTFIYYILFTYVMIDDKLKKRTLLLEKEAMHFFEVLTLSLETGRNLVSAFEVTTKNVSGVLSNEFKESIRQVQFGKSLSESLYDMQDRIPSETINNIILSLTQANMYGNGIIENLNMQIDYLREKHKMEVKGRISKVPVLISVISVFFFIPMLLIIILGPILLDYIGLK